MKTLAERHEDRAQRKADNAVESADYKNSTGGGVGHAANLMAEAEAAYKGLTEEQRAELREVSRDGFANAADAYGDAFDGEGNLRTAGVGVVNPLIAPSSARTATEDASGTAGTGGEGGWGSDANTDLREGENANGAALDGATGGTDGTNAPPLTAKQKADLAKKEAAQNGS